MSQYIVKITHASGKSIGNVAYVVRRGKNGETCLKKAPRNKWDLVTFGDPEEAISFTRELFDKLKKKFAGNPFTTGQKFPRICICVEKIST